MLASTLSFMLALAATTTAHTGAYGPGMYCRNGNVRGETNYNSNIVVNPVYQQTKENYWFQHDRGCDAFPPPPGEFLELPAGGSFTVELAHNQAFTTLSYGGSKVSDWPDGGEHPDDWSGWTGEGEGCIQEDGALHVQNETSATGTAFAISYHSDIKDVTMENLVAFSVADHTPFRRLTTYQVPDLPACPRGGCICAWLWVPKGCGEPNMYMQGFKCTVTGATATHAVASAKTPVYCKDDPSKCVVGAKSMIVFNQAEGNNVPVPREAKSPGYNPTCGFFPGAQKDIFVGGSAAPPASGAPIPAPPSSSPVRAASASASVPPIAPAPVPPISSAGPVTSRIFVEPPRPSSDRPVTSRIIAEPAQPSSDRPATSRIFVQPSRSLDLPNISSRIFAQPRPTSGFPGVGTTLTSRIRPVPTDTVASPGKSCKAKRR